MTLVHLDPGQHDVASVSATARQVVIAGPGAGKTHVVSRLVENLVVEEGVDPVHGLLVLSFSNAAVYAVDARLRAHGVPPAHVRTVDSLAGRIVSEGADDDVAGMTFERRIIRATDLVREHEWPDADDLEHLVVDEVQDVVGVRADFLLALMSEMPEEAGVTLLGDPAQAIYDFQLEQEGESATTSAQLFERARAAGARTVVLEGQYRAITRETRAAAGLRGEGETVPHHHDIEDFWNEVVHAGDLAAAADLLRTKEGSTAFLTSTNGQALVVAQALRSAGLDVVVRRGMHQQMLAGWIARLFSQVDGASLTREEFGRLMREVSPEADAAARWRALKSLAGGRGRELDAVSLVSNLSSRYSVPPDLTDFQADDAVVSTIHRAKGLEFDNVVLVDFADGGREQSAEVAGRERFVALTRARTMLARAEGPDTHWIRTIPSASGSARRWIRGGPQPWMTTSIEARAGDIDVESMASEPSAHEFMSTATGLQVELVPSPTKSNLRVPIFDVTCSGTVIGSTTTDFGMDVAGRIGTLEGKRRGWPTLTGCMSRALSRFWEPD